jgi:UDP-glucuronate decarboxylase
MHPNDGRVVSNFVVQALNGEELTIYGEGSQTRSFCYVTDLIEGFIRLMATPDDVIGPINLGNPEEFTIRELAQLTAELSGTTTSLRFLPLPSDDPVQRRPDIKKSRDLLGWHPEIKLRDGLSKTIDYFKESAKNQ